jgi:hypothetical protein
MRSWVLVFGVLVACVGPIQHVPDAWVGDVPPYLAEQISALESGIRQLETEAVDARLRAAQASQAYDEQARIAALHEAQTAEDDQRKRDAVERGHPVSGAGTELRRASQQVELLQARSGESAAAAASRLADAELALAEAELRLAQSRLEELRSVAVGADVDVTFFLDQTAREVRRVEAARRALGKLQPEGASIAP